MMERYHHPLADTILSAPMRTTVWFEIERAWIEAKFGVLINPCDVDPDEPPLTDEAANELTVRRCELEATNGHDVASFVQAVAEMWPHERWATHLFHYGLTSSDVVDTADSILLRGLGGAFQGALQRVYHQLDRLTNEVGGFVWTTTHGRRAAPVHASHPFAVWRSRVHQAQHMISDAVVYNCVGRFRGPAGTSNDRGDEMKACRALYLEPADKTFQAIGRETRAVYYQTVATVLSVLDGLATHVKRWTCEERDGFPALESGDAEHSPSTISSSMPHKAKLPNPTPLERVHGLSAVYSGACTASLTTLPTWDERDIAHSSADRALTEMGGHFLLLAADSITAHLENSTICPGMPTRPRSSFDSLHDLIDSGMSRAQATSEVNK